MCIHKGNSCVCVPNMKFLCLILWPEQVCTDANDANADTNYADAQSMIVPRSLVDKPNMPIKKLNYLQIIVMVEHDRLSLEPITRFTFLVFLQHVFPPLVHLRPSLIQ